MISAQPASLKNIILYAGETRHPKNGRRVHTLGLQGEFLSSDEGPNAIIIPLPAAQGLGQGNLITIPSGFLETLAEPIRKDTPKQIELGKKKPVRIMKGLPKLYCGKFHSVDFLSDIRSLTQALPGIPASVGLIESLAQAYPRWPVMVCSWFGAVRTEPLMVWYHPQDESTLFYPGVTNIKGKPANMDYAPVRDHTMLVASEDHPIGYLNMSPSAFVPGYTWGKVLQGHDFNRDMVVNTEAIAQGRNKARPHSDLLHLVDAAWALDFDCRPLGQPSSRAS